MGTPHLHSLRNELSQVGVLPHTTCKEGPPMNGIIYLVGLIVVIMFILSFLGLR